MSREQLILTVGTAHVELLLGYKNPSDGDVALLDCPPFTRCGGTGGAEALAMTKLGYKAALCSLVGDDQNGRSFAAYLKEKGVDTRFLAKAPGGKTTYIATLKKEGESKQTLLYPGQVGKMSFHLVEEAFMCMPDGVSLHTELPFDILLHAAGLAAQKHIPLFLDAGYVREDFRAEDLPTFEILSLSEDAVKQMTGITLGGTESCVKAALALSDKIKAKYFVFRLGVRGCFLFDGKMIHHFAPPRLEFSSSEGDRAFVGALVGGYLESKGDIRFACKWANGAMSLTSSKRNEENPYPLRGELEALVSSK